MPMARPAHVVAVAEGEGGQGEEQSPADHPAEGLDEDGVEQEGGREQTDCRQSAGWPSSMSSPASCLTDPAAGDVEGVEGGDHEERGADDEGQRLRTDRVVAARRGTDPGGVPDDDQPDQGQGRAQAVLRAVPDPAGSRGGLGGHARPRVWRSWATCGVLLLEEGAELLAGGEGVDPAALLQLGLPRRRLVHLGEGVDPDLLVLLGEPGGATTPRQLANSRSMPFSLRVGTSLSASTRSGLVTARTRTSPASTWSRNSPKPEAPKAILLPSSAGSSSPPPSYDT